MRTQIPHAHRSAHAAREPQQPKGAPQWPYAPSPDLRGPRRTCALVDCNSRIRSSAQISFRGIRLVHRHYRINCYSPLGCRKLIGPDHCFEVCLNQVFQRDALQPPKRRLYCLNVIGFFTFNQAEKFPSQPQRLVSASATLGSIGSCLTISVIGICQSTSSKERIPTIKARSWASPLGRVAH